MYTNFWICFCIFSILEGVHCAVLGYGHLVIYGGQKGPDVPAVNEFVSRVLVPMYKQSSSVLKIFWITYNIGSGLFYSLVTDGNKREFHNIVLI